MFVKDVVIDNIHRGKIEQKRDHIIYARLEDADSKETIISADIDYVLRACRQRYYRIINAQEVLEELLELNVF